MNFRRVGSIFIAAIIMTVGVGFSDYLELVSDQDTWEYAILNQDLWSNWASVDYATIDWSAQSYQAGQAAFGNADSYGGQSVPTPNTIWNAGTDLALVKEVTLNGTINGDLTLNVACDNGFAIFVNGNMIAKDNAEGFTQIWEYSYTVSSSVFNQGLNTVEVLTEDHGGLTYFDMKIAGDVTPIAVPEPCVNMLLGFGLVCLAGLRRFTKRK